MSVIRHARFPNGNIYLSGGMQHADDLGAGWRILCGKVLREMDYYPLDITELDKEYTRQHNDYHRSIMDDEVLQRKSNIRKQFVQTDLDLIINDTDALVIYYDESVRLGAGTISECQIAFSNDIPVFLVSSYPDWRKEVPGWLQALTTKIFTDFHALYAYLERLPTGILRRDVYGNHNAGDKYLCSLCGEPFQKNKHHFVSKVSPLYCTTCVDVTTTTFEQHKDRYAFFIEHISMDQSITITFPDKHDG